MRILDNKRDGYFVDCAANDAANFTNRSPWPVIHLLREESVEQAIASHPDTARIPERNIRLAREKGGTWWEDLLKNLRPL